MPKASRRTLLGVAGWPVAHSRSPAMQNAALAQLGLDWLYVPLPLAPPLFEETVEALAASGFRGINVTVPHKQAALAVATERSEAAAAIGAANTLTFSEGSIFAENTDAPGLLAALGEPVTGRSALVLGAGGAARAAASALVGAGAVVAIWNRTIERAEALAQDLGAMAVQSAQDADLVVNATAVGLGGETADALPLAALEPQTVVDMVYANGPTPVERWAADRGARFVHGLEVLVNQGARSLELWTGRDAPLDAMRHAVRDPDA